MVGSDAILSCDGPKINGTYEDYPLSISIAREKLKEEEVVEIDHINGYETIKSSERENDAGQHTVTVYRLTTDLCPPSDPYQKGILPGVSAFSLINYFSLVQTAARKPKHPNSDTDDVLVIQNTCDVVATRTTAVRSSSSSLLIGLTPLS